MNTNMLVKKLWNYYCCCAGAVQVDREGAMGADLIEKAEQFGQD